MLDRKAYEKPAVQAYGDIKALTAAGCTEKAFGLSDGFTLQQQPIRFDCS